MDVWNFGRCPKGRNAHVWAFCKLGNAEKPIFGASASCRIEKNQFLSLLQVREWRKTHFSAFCKLAIAAAWMFGQSANLGMLLPHVSTRKAV
ncbi:hypothetical protein [Reichenbachiella ulvae]|uniref:Uncharacterized protein n=1 Tax=Reichenbachiella ulvae TaxID=2980104 RepID=A0ABT3CWA3_9BACT|nr:hypothetical protein [Reichenbachiella ulvae]MCV9387884.1 hypothetical protein [Reichenbachiella ulvae]